MAMELHKRPPTRATGSDRTASTTVMTLPAPTPDTTPTVPARGRRQHGAVRTEQRILVTRVGLAIPTGLTYDGWEKAGRRLSTVADSSTWCIGDWVVYGQTRYVDRY